MPIYVYECECGKEYEAFRKVDDRLLPYVCHNCGDNAKLKIATPKGKDWFRPHWNEDFNHTRPIYVESKQHYKNLCKEHGVYARCLM